MLRILRFMTALLAVAGLAAVDGSVFAQPKGPKDKEHKEQGESKPHKEKKQKHNSGKEMLGEKVKKDGRHKIHENGKHSAFVNVSKGKVTGVSVKHADKGEVPVKKYKYRTTKKMAEQVGGMQPVSLLLAQSGTQYLGETWIGYAYIDDWGYEVIYWFPYDMIMDMDTGAIEYIPAD